MKIVRLPAFAGLFASVLVSAHAVTYEENFTHDPSLDGWQTFGDTNLFSWNSTNKNLQVTWDSTQVNSYYYLPLGQTYTVTNGFYVRFDLQLNDAAAFNSGSQLALGLLHYSDATDPSFSRINFVSPNLCEFDYFPQFTYGMTVYPDSVEASMIDDTGYGVYQAQDNLTLIPGVTYRIEFMHAAGAESITCDVSTNGQIITSLPITATYNGPLGDFQLDMLAVINYNSDDGFGDSVLAHGWVSDLAFTSPLPVNLVQTQNAGKIQSGNSDTNWVYTLEQSTDLQQWTAAAPAVFGSGTNLLLQATNPPASGAFYRVQAELP